MKKVLIATMIVLAFSLVLARGGHGRRGRGHGRGGHGRMWMNEAVLEDIGVKESVRTEIRKMMYEAKKRAMDNGFKVRELKLQMKKEFEKSSPSKAVLKNLAEKIAEIKKQQILIMEKSKIDIMFKLTVDQRKQIMQHMMNNKRRFMKRMMRE